jgi:hypothetical protein
MLPTCGQQRLSHLATYLRKLRPVQDQEGLPGQLRLCAPKLGFVGSGLSVLGWSGFWGLGLGLGLG